MDRVYQMDIAMCQYKQGRFDDALAQLNRTRDLDKHWPLFDLAECLFLLAQEDDPSALAAATRTETGLGPAPVTLVIRAQS